MPFLPSSSRVVQVCHPDWRGVRTATEAFGTPVIAQRDLSSSALVEHLRTAAVERLVIQGWPPGADLLARRARAAGIAVGVVSHASLAQHGTDGGEMERVAEMLVLAGEGVIDRLGFVKRGLAEAFRALGYAAIEVPNRMPRIPDLQAEDMAGPGPHVGVFLHPHWRKNVTTQVAAALLLGAQVHVIQSPLIPYFPTERIVVHGELPRDRFLPKLAGVDINFNVTLSECHPVTPMESYLLGVPCLISHTSALFSDDPELLGLTAVIDLDDPHRISHQARHLLAAKPEAIARALASMQRMDVAAATRWDEFVA